MRQHREKSNSPKGTKKKKGQWCENGCGLASVSRLFPLVTLQVLSGQGPKGTDNRNMPGGAANPPLKAHGPRPSPLPQWVRGASLVNCVPELKHAKLNKRYSLAMLRHVWPRASGHFAEAHSPSQFETLRLRMNLHTWH
jgi:hypothetical protein